jgi:hypothetical protein
VLSGKTICSGIYAGFCGRGFSESPSRCITGSLKPHISKCSKISCPSTPITCFSIGSLEGETDCHPWRISWCCHSMTTGWVVPKVHGNILLAWKRSGQLTQFPLARGKNPYLFRTRLPVIPEGRCTGKFLKELRFHLSYKKP